VPRLAWRPAFSHARSKTRPRDLSDPAWVFGGPSGHRAGKPTLDPISRTINKVFAKGTQENLLPVILRRWFGDDAGKPGTGFKVWLRRRGDLVSMEPVSLARAAERDG
jgi:hypothetical protein